MPFGNMKPLAPLLLLCLVVGCQDHRHYAELIQLRDRIQANPDDSQALEQLLAYLPSKHWLDPANAAGCLRQLAEGPSNKQRVVPRIAHRAVPVLVAQAEHVGRAATEALKEYGEYLLPYKTNLITIVQNHPDEDIGWFAAQALANLGTNASDALPAIEAIPVHDFTRAWRDTVIKNIRGEQ